MPDRPTRVMLSGATVILPDRLESGATLVIEDGRIVELARGPRAVGAGDLRIDLQGHVIAPGFVDVHVHGVMGVDVLEGRGAVARLARSLPRFGVTAFCPTAVACEPSVLGAMFQEIAELRADPAADAARVLGAHLESHFINPEFAGAQPANCLRRASDLFAPPDGAAASVAFAARDVMDVVERHRADVGVFTLAPEIDGGMSLLRSLVASGVRVSIGHTGASFDQAQEAIAAGACHATHLFNRMTPLSARAPGVAGAVLANDACAAEIIADGHHVHPAAVHVAWRSKGPPRMMAITDGTAGAGLPLGSRANLGGRPIIVGETARLEDGTMAGSVATMDRVFAQLVTACGADLVQAATMCATTPAREMGMHGHGVIAAGAAADLVILDAGFSVVQTWIGGRQAWIAPGGTPGWRKTS